MKPVDLDQLMTLDELAAWLKLSSPTVTKNTQAGKIPCIRINRKIVRYHPRTVLDALHKRGKR